MLPVIALEEHYIDQEALDSSPSDARTFAICPPPLLRALASLGADRLADLETHGIALQILSHLPLEDPSPKICVAANDRLHAAARASPRYAAFAMLPMAHPAAAAAELARAVRTLRFAGALVGNHARGASYEGPAYAPLFAAAQDLAAPLYLHPSFPAPAAQAHYAGAYPETTAAVLGSYAWGWHSDAALHVLRLFAAGVFDRFPRLRLVIGHMGEMLPFMLDRIVGMADRGTLPGLSGHERGLREVWENNIWVTTSGMFSLAPMACLLRVTPLEKIMFSVDYPFAGNDQGRKFMDELEASGLVDREGLEMIAYRNAEALLGVGLPKSDKEAI